MIKPLEYYKMSNPNILLIIMDTVRASNTSLYGYERDTTPFLRELKDECATLYEHSWAPTNWSLPSHVSIFSGYHTKEHNVTSEEDKIEPSESIFYELKEEGYETATFNDNSWITDTDSGLSEGFQDIISTGVTPYPDAVNPSKFLGKNGTKEYIKYLKESLRHENTLASLLNGVISKARGDVPGLVPRKFRVKFNGYDYVEPFSDWIDDTGDTWAAFINLMDAHTPYHPKGRHVKWSDSLVHDIHVDTPRFSYYNDEEWWKLKAQESLYDDCIHQVDDIVSNIIEVLKQKNEFEDTYIVITSDHGDSFGSYHQVSQHRTIHHQPTIHEDVLRVPLLIKEPHQKESSKVDELATLTNYKDSVRSALNGGDIQSSITDNTIVASYSGSNTQSVKKFEETHGDRNIAEERGKVAYKKREGRVIKFMNWEDKYGVRIISDQDLEERRSGRKVDKIFSHVDVKDLNVGSDASEIDEDIEERLEELGYI